MPNQLAYKFIKPDKSLADFVYSFSSLDNIEKIKEGVIIPNGKVDLLFYKTTDNQLCISLMGLETQPKPVLEGSISAFFAINFNPLAVEYILQQSIAELLNNGKILPGNFWNFHIDDLDNFETFCEKATQKISSIIPKEIDERKRKLFESIFANNGEMRIKELSEKLF